MARWQKREADRAGREKRDRQVQLWQACGAEARHRGRQLGELAMHSQWARAFDAACGVVDAGGMLALLGDRGTGKTQLAVMVMRRCCLALRWCRYIRCREVAVRLRRAFACDAEVTELEALEEFTRPHLLVLDEVQQVGTTDFARDSLVDLLDRRYAGVRATVLIANVHEDAFKAIVGDAVVDRLREGGAVIPFDWPSFRGAGDAGAPGTNVEEDPRRSL